MKTFDKSSKLEHVAYDIRGPVLDEANRMIAKGEKILRLNTGNPAEFGFTAPDEVIRDLIMNVIKECSKGMNITASEQSFIADFYKYSFVGLMLDWIKQGMKDDYVDLAHKISITIHGSLTHSIENFAALPKKENS